MLIGAYTQVGNGNFASFDYTTDTVEPINTKYTTSVAFFPEGDKIVQGSTTDNITIFNY